MRVLVTGGAGYIGSHACKALAMAGHEPVVLDNLVTGRREAVRWGPLIEADLRDAAALDAIWRDHRPDLVMHFAALSTVAESMRRPELYYDNNVVGSLTLLEAMRRGGTSSIVFSSTCAVYGAPSVTPITEGAPRNPINTYGVTKYVVERMLEDHGRAHGLNWMALRYFNAAGADPDGELGENHEPETHALPLAIQAALGTGPAFSVFGRDYDTADGTAVRDYVHVSDLADAHVLAAAHLAAGGASEALNLGTGVGASVEELLGAVEAAAGCPVPRTYAPRRDGDAPTLFADPTRAREVLGWSARRRNLTETAAHAVAWARNPLL